MFTFIICVAFLIGALICYASCCVASKADRQSEECWQKHLKKNSKKIIKTNQRENELILRGYNLGYEAGLQENLKQYTCNEIRELFNLPKIEK